MTKTSTKLLENTQRYRKTKKGVLTNIYNKQKERSRERGFPEPNYSLQELHDKFLDDNKFNRIFREWVRSGYSKEAKPTIDRIDCLKPYKKDNIQVLNWAENRYKQRFEFKRIRAKKVYKVVGNRVVNIYKSVSHAVRETGIHQGNISSCLNGRRKTAGGYRWSYENPELIK